MEPSFWSWEKHQALTAERIDYVVAMEPSFWSWEKQTVSAHTQRA